MTGPSVCDGYGIASHPAGGLVEVRAPIPMHLCGPCFRRWVETPKKGTTDG